MIASATVCGRDHRWRWRNGQDAAFAGELEADVAFGLVLDGCGSGPRLDDRALPSRNEVGAQLLGGYLANWLRGALSEREQAQDLLERLGDATGQFLQGVEALVPAAEPERSLFVGSQLLCTVVGFVVRPSDALLYWSGDGYALLNDYVWALGEGDTPDYPAYRLLDGRERPFQGVMALDRARLRRLAVASDGWSRQLLASLPGPCARLDLERWITRQAGMPGHFEDDGALAAWWAEEAAS